MQGAGDTALVANQSVSQGAGDTAPMAADSVQGQGDPGQEDLGEKVQAKSRTRPVAPSAKEVA